MPGDYCRGCGKSKIILSVTDPSQCPDDGPVKVAVRMYCERCGQKLQKKGQNPCPYCKKKAFKCYGK